jgi:hypothetical protein
MLSPQYIAGFFDGEGSIGIYPNSRGTYFLRTQLTQNVSFSSRFLLTNLKSSFSGNLSIQRTTHGEKFNWQLNADLAANFLTEIAPFLIMKRDQAELALLWWSGRPPQKRGTDGRLQSTARPIDATVASLLKALKKTDIDAVMKAQEDLVEVKHTLKQVLCVKG